MRQLARRFGLLRHRRTWLCGVALAVAASAPVAALEYPVWSADGTSLLGITCSQRRAELVAIDAATGNRTWSSPLTGIASSCKRLRQRSFAIQPGPDGNSALLISGAELYWASRDTAGPADLKLSHAEIGAPQLSPDARQIGFLRQGDLWTFSIALRSAKQLTRALGIETAPRNVMPFAWRPDSRSIAFMADGRVGLVDLLAPPPRLLNLEPAAGSAGVLSFAWRYDSRAIAVVEGRDSEDLERVSFCHAEKLHCRLLASRQALAVEAPAGDLRFLENGFAWAEKIAGGDVGIAWFDPLGRRRSSVSPAGASVVTLAAALFDSDQLVLETRSSTESARTWVLIDLDRRNAATAIPIEAGSVPLFSPETPYYATTREEDGRIVARTLRTLDGSKVADLPPTSP